VHIDVIRNTFRVGKRVYPLDKYRQFLLTNYSDLCSKMFIRLIYVNGKRLATYDWSTAFELAAEAGAQQQFLKSIL